MWEAKLEYSSFGFRPCRGVSDAITKIHTVACRLKRPYVFEGDFKSCFDTLNHQHILSKLGNFPLKKLINKWLEAGYLENNIFHRTRAGTPQGGIISPLLANIALNGMEEALNIKYKLRMIHGKEYYTNPSKYVVVKYADDFIVLCRTLKDAEAVYSLLEDYLEDRGLTLAPDKTQITHISDGFDFLGFNIRSYRGSDREKLLIKASKDSIKSFKAKVKDIIRMCYPWNLEQSIIKLNYLINGVGNYWKMGTNKKLFSKMDHYIYELWMRQIKRWHPNKSVRWRVNKYFKMSKHPGHNYKWTFTDPNTGIQVDMMYWIKIKYPRCIKYNATPYDSEYEDYFNEIKSIKPFEYLYG